MSHVGNGKKHQSFVGQLLTNSLLYIVTRAILEYTYKSINNSNFIAIMSSMFVWLEEKSLDFVVKPKKQILIV